eukprot:TRINITY_DN17768_c0_g1_i1.p1 TRINITY_DN17768_c0_g1~~TRINITY_DN17768_c0_g1_i1.p1  ORF type:complete len:410 (-),score=104.71 TRINITY_DN17768_c0_g1_i1:35-1264(-)
MLTERLKLGRGDSFGSDYSDDLEPGSPTPSAFKARGEFPGALSDPKPTKALTQSQAFAFFLCGMLNQFSYTVMLAAAKSMLGELPLSLALLADDAPACCMQYLAPRIPVPFKHRIRLVAACTGAAFLLCAWSSSAVLRLLGIGLCSLAFGVGESALLNKAAELPEDAVASFSAGSGFSGILGTASYMMLTSMLAPWSTLTLLAPLPGLLLLRAAEALPPCAPSVQKKDDDRSAAAAPKRAVSDGTIVRLYFAPLFFVYFFTFSLNHALLPHLVVHFAPPIDQAYVHYFFVYHIGVCAGRCACRWLQVPVLVLVKVQGILWCGVLVHEAHVRVGWLDLSLSGYNECLIIMCVLGFCIGLAYGCTFSALQREIPGASKARATAIVSMATTTGPIAAGVVGVLLEWLVVWLN